MEEIFPKAYLNDMNRFARTVWGNPQALLRQTHPQGVEFIDLTEFLPAFRHFTAGYLRNGKILIRDEYRIARQALQTDVYLHGVYVTGQPGIGKTYFLFYLLVYFLGQRQRVMMQLLSGDPYYLVFGDTVTFHSLMHVHECEFVWALCPSNEDIEIPPAAYFCLPKVRVIQATPPQHSRWKGWSKQWDAECYIMDIWTEEEVANLATLLGLDVERMTTLARKWGTIPQKLLQFFGEEDQIVEAWYRECSRKAVINCSTIMMNGPILYFPEVPSPFYFLRPKEPDSEPSCRLFGYMCVPTRTLRELLATGLQGQEKPIKDDFFRVLSNEAKTLQTGSFIFESWFHSFFSTENEIECQWLTRGSVDDTKQSSTILRWTTVVIHAAQDASFPRTTPFYWIPPVGYLPGIDSVLVLEKEIFAFQVNIKITNRSPLKGLQKLQKILPDNLKDLPRRLVSVGERACTAELVAQAWAGELCNPMQPVGWSVVDPVHDKVAYRTYRDESDPVLEHLDEAMMAVEE